jgi:CRP-like cAMP-binding protein
VNYVAAMTPSDEDSAVQQLASVPLFSHLSPRHLRSVVRSGAQQTWPAGQKIVTKGEKGVGFFLILEGEVEIRPNGKVLAKLGPGKFFGEMALFAEESRTADVVATAATRCLVLSRWEFWGAMSKEPEVLRELMAELVHRLRATANALSE